MSYCDWILISQVKKNNVSQHPNYQQKEIVQYSTGEKYIYLDLNVFSSLNIIHT